MIPLEDENIAQLALLFSQRDCYDDSPNYNQLLSKFESFSKDLFVRNSELIKLANQHSTAIKEFATTKKKLWNKLSNLVESCPLEASIADGLKINYLETLGKIDSLQINKDLQNIEVLQIGLEVLTNEFDKNNKLRQRYEKTRTDYHKFLPKFLSLPPNDPKLNNYESESMRLKESYLLSKHEYATNLGKLASIKISELVDQLLMSSFIQISHFNNASDMISGTQQKIHDLSVNLSNLQNLFFSLIKTKSADLKRSDSKLLERSSMTDSSLSNNNNGSNGVDLRKRSLPDDECRMQGYLSLRLKNNSWSRMWFEIQGLNLIYDTNQNDKEKGTIPLMLSKTKDTPFALQKLSEEHGRPFLFELISPQQSYIFQAESELELKKWIESINTQIQLSIYHFGHSTTENKSVDLQQLLRTKNKSYASLKNQVANSFDSASTKSLKKSLEFSNPNEVLGSILNLPGNKFCADCGTRNPTWAVINFGVLVCINCSGTHRSLGVQVSKVRSIQLDKIDSEHLHILQRLGNSTVNNFLDPDSEYKPSPSSSNDSLQAYISNKYLLKKYIKYLPNSSKSRLSSDSDVPVLNDLLYRSALEADLPTMLQLLLLGAKPNYINSESNHSVLVAAVTNSDYGAAELLLMHGADVDLYIQPIKAISAPDTPDLANLSPNSPTQLPDRSQMDHHKLEDIKSTLNTEPTQLTILEDQMSSLSANEEYNPEAYFSDVNRPNQSGRFTRPDSKLGQSASFSALSSDLPDGSTGATERSEDTGKNLLRGEVSDSIRNDSVSECTTAATTPKILQQQTAQQKPEVSNQPHLLEQHQETSEANQVVRVGEYSPQTYFAVHGGTAVHAAACKDDAAMIVYLIRKKADTNKLNSSGLKPIDIAVMFGNAMVVMTFRYFSFIKSDDTLSLESIANTLDQEFAIPQIFTPRNPTFS